MSTTRKLLTVVAAAVAVAASTPGSISAQDGKGSATRSEVDTTFFFSRIGTVLLGNGAATIVVRGWDQASVRVKARNDDGGLRFEATTSRLVVETTRQHDDAIIEVTVPRGVRVVARSNTGDITVRDTDVRVCAQCVAQGDAWVQLRMCMTCGQVGCCDSSKNRHATAHFAQTRHPIIRSIEPHEDWKWCYVDERLVDEPAAAR